jgi:hypothetical protein
MALQYVYVGDHAQPLANGRTLVHDDVVDESELAESEQYLVNDEKLIEPPPTEAAEPEPPKRKGASHAA